ncbi:STAS domain-containing protein [Dyella soli]|uniref:STAS domain-containing protein n=1 Tax=Dyella soli TaxID=522319 RepID=A0A4R0YKG3_9GAMM|nr:STAS domain-containing protein [Dyella soli]TCI06765.1 STAS domain-containing protein [Dyella soli]
MVNKTAKRTGEGEARRVLLPTDFRLAEVAAVKAELIDAFDAPAVQLDGGGVERVDTAALQLLVAFRREALARGLTPAWQGVSGAMRDAANLLGLAQALELPATMPA